ncbi:hypothetical protein BU204_03295 [Actinophytocola xanthii]|uniref:Peptidase S8/S53 domain-containing protein n=2 Tax=Actinophytocola xanthii TaxID=1912961 RepID=A0A1Q8CX18_9PSEU|nr:hypothetical protein BU204_03295 [Actinophytocola xanthii]
MIVTVLTALAFAAAPTPTSATTNPDPASDTVTLVTGDRVFLRVDGSVAGLRPAPGREHIPVHTYRDGAGTHVVPGDATRPLATGRLDPRLFDVTLLRELGYGETAEPLPLIVDGQVPGARAAPRLPEGVAARVTRSVDTWRVLAGARRVWLDGRRRLSLDRSVPHIGAPAAWQAGLTGAGVTVAVLDSGVDHDHPDLAGREVAERNFTDSPDTVDRHGHGTHVASTIAGQDAVYRGVAPGVRIMDGKVVDDDGWATDSAILAGMRWAAENGARVVNLSLGGQDTPGTDPVEAAVDSLSAEYGTLFVAAAGNGARPGTIGSPASAAAALAVGAVDLDGAVASFSSRGPGLDRVVKPEITAPGVDITAAAPGGGHATASGTSMATPHVTGAAALLAERNPGWTGQRLRAALTGSAGPTSDAGVFEQGAGQVDVARALTSPLSTSPPVVDLGVVRYPNAEPVTRTLTYHNDGAADLTLDLAVDAAGFSLGSDSLTVPARGQAAVEVTALPGSGTTTVTASAGALSVRTPVGVVWEPESYDVEVTVLDRDGRPAADYDLLRLGFGEEGSQFHHDPDGTVSLRLRAGRHVLKATVYGDRAHEVVYPALTVDGDTAVTLDARTARPVAVDLPDGDARADGFDVGFAVELPDGEVSSHSVMYSSPDQVAVAHAGPSSAGVIAWLAGQWAGGTSNYNLAWFRRGGGFTGFDRAVDRGDLARLTTRLAAVAPGATGDLLMWPAPLGGFSPAFQFAPPQARPVEVALPAARTTWVSTDVEWSTALWQQTDTGRSTVQTPERRYRPGRHTVEDLGRPVFGPALPPTRYPTPGAYRTGNWIVARVPLFGDGAGNAGTSTVDDARTVLYRNGVEVGDVPAPGSGEFEVPPEAAEYRLSTSATRSGTELSTHVAATWTFRSAHVPATSTRRLPLSAIGFRPALSTTGTAPVGPFAVPVVVTGPTGQPVRPRRLTVEVSYDDGDTWQVVPVDRDQVASLTHPAGPGSVSLRASAVNHDGTTVTHTLVRAYLLEHQP